MSKTSHPTLLRQTLMTPVKVLTEDSGDGKPKNHFFEGIVMQAEVENVNGRNYPIEEIIEAVELYNKKFI
jgi:hypothetical protein